MFYAITGQQNGLTVYWAKWSSPTAAGRPGWTNSLKPECLFASRKHAEKTAAGSGSSHWTTTGVEQIAVVNVHLTIVAD